MRKFFACGVIFLTLILCSACTLVKPDSAVKLLVESPQGEPITEMYVYAEKYPDGREIFPGPLLGVTDENGILEYQPEAYGTQNLTFVKYGFTTDGIERRKAEETVPYGVVAVKVTRKDITQSRTISVQIPSVPFAEGQ